MERGRERGHMKRLFIENQPYTLFYNDETAKCYEERCLSMSSEGDLIVTSYPIDKKYKEYLSSMGVPLNCEFLTPSYNKKDLASSIFHDKELLTYLHEITNRDDWVIETFLPNRSLLAISQILDVPLSFPLIIYNKFSTKEGFKIMADRLNLPTAPGIVVSKDHFKGALSLFDEHGKIIIKYNNTVGGLGVFIPDSKRELIEKIMASPTRNIVIEENIKPDIQGSIQIFIKNKNYQIIIDECVIENMRFIGFKYPFRYEDGNITRFGEKVARFLVNEGVKSGFFGLDFIIKNNNLYIHDFNPRKTGVSYVLCFLSKLFGNGWMKNSEIISEHLSLPTLKQWYVKDVIAKLLPLLFNYGIKNEGILLFNCSLLKFNKLHLISISFCGKAKEYFQEAKRILGLAK